MHLARAARVRESARSADQSLRRRESLPRPSPRWLPFSSELLQHAKIVLQKRADVRNVELDHRHATSSRIVIFELSSKWRPLRSTSCQATVDERQFRAYVSSIPQVDGAGHQY